MWVELKGKTGVSFYYLDTQQNSAILLHLFSCSREISSGSGNKISQKDPSVINGLHLNPVLTGVSVRLQQDCREVIGWVCDADGYAINMFKTPSPSKRKPY